MKNKRNVKHKFLNLNDNEKIKGKWTDEEQKKFWNAVNLYGKNWKKIENYIKTRTASQIRSHAQKYFSKSNSNEINLDKIEIEKSEEEKEEEDNEENSIEEEDNKEESLNFSESEVSTIKKSISNDSISEEIIDISKENNNNNYVTKNQIFKSFIEQMKIIISEIKGNSDVNKKIKIMEIWKDISLNVKKMYKTFKNEDDNFNGKLEYNTILQEINSLSKEIEFNIKNPYLWINNSNQYINNQSNYDDLKNNNLERKKSLWSENSEIKNKNNLNTQNN